MNAFVPSPKPINPLMQAVAFIRSKGHQCGTTDIPGLFSVSGQAEMTIGQVMNFARSLGWQPV